MMLIFYHSLLFLLPLSAQFSSIFSTADVTEVTAILMSCSLLSESLAYLAIACTKQGYNTWNISMAVLLLEQKYEGKKDVLLLFKHSKWDEETAAAPLMTLFLRYSCFLYTTITLNIGIPRLLNKSTSYAHISQFQSLQLIFKGMDTFTDRQTQLKHMD